VFSDCNYEEGREKEGGDVGVIPGKRLYDFNYPSHLPAPASAPHEPASLSGARSILARSRTTGDILWSFEP
jgi:hypothetical protein